MSCHVGAAPLEHGLMTVRMSLGFCHSESDVCRSIERESEKFGGPVSAVGFLSSSCSGAESAVLVDVLSL